MTQDRFPSDPQTRKRWLLSTAGGIAFFAAMYVATKTLAHVPPDASEQELERALLRMQILTTGLLLVISGGALYAARRYERTARRVLAADQFPPPGMLMPFATQVRRGVKSRPYVWYYRISALLAFVVAVANLWGIYLIW